ncbi:MAG: hypothetical protein ACE5JX_22735 [Acidobacteriota bacterium]
MAQNIRPPFWRRKFYVHAIQRKYFFLSMMPLVYCAFLLIILAFAPESLALQGPAAADAGRVSILGQSYPLGGVRIWLAVIISMLACSLHSFFVTHKFAGPLYRFEQVLQKVKEGDFPVSVRIRQGDDLQEFAGHLDSALRTIASALNGIKEQQALAVQEVGALQGKVTGEANGEVLRGLEGIGRNLKEVEIILANFKLPSGDGSTTKATEEE